MGTWPIYKKTLPTTDLNNNIKKQLSFDKISPCDFFSFLFNLCLLIIGFDYFDDLFGTFPYFVKIIFFTIDLNMWSRIPEDGLEVDDLLKYYWFVNAENNHRCCLGHFSGV